MIPVARAAALVACGCLLLGGCSAGSDPVAAPPVTAAPSGASAGPASAAASGTVIEAEYTGGRIRGVESRVAVPLGERVLLRVTSDVAEQIHVHGYDLYLDLAPGTPAELSFTADKPGAYEVELHEARRPLLQLRVS